MHTLDWISRWASYHPGKPAVSEYETGRSLSYGELDRLACRLARHLLRDLGLRRGSRVAVLAENCLEYVVLFAAAQKTGLILTPLNYRLSTGELEYQIRHCQPELMIAEESWLPLLAPAPAYAQIPRRMGLAALRALLDPAQPHADDSPFAAEDLPQETDPVFILYTSGSTGYPKGVCYTHRMLLWNSLNTALRLDITSQDRTISVMPPFHTGGWNVLLTPFLHHGAYTCLMRKFDAQAVLEGLEREQATLFMGVPTMLKMMAGAPGYAAAQLGSLRYFIAGGEAMPVPLIEQWHQKGIPIRQGYGMTEAGPNLTSLHQDDAIRKKGSIGKPNFYVDIRLADESGRDAAPGEAGELLIRGPMVTPGYWNDPGATAQAIQDGWLRTGDLVRQDGEGFLYIVDRVKNMFISGGENVYPAEIERVLLQHAAVCEAAVVPEPHPKWGETGRAYVALHPEQQLSEAEILAYCEGRLARFKIPKAAVILPELPKNGAGKIDRQALKRLAQG
jgi:fatty-acyl-CoA synthase